MTYYNYVIFKNLLCVFLYSQIIYMFSFMFLVTGKNAEALPKKPGPTKQKKDGYTEKGSDGRNLGRVRSELEIFQDELEKNILHVIFFTLALTNIALFRI